MEFEGLPELCIASILNRTTPFDACRFSPLSKIFHSAVESDLVWEHFLPSDYRSDISQSVSPLNYPSKKAQSFQLDKKSGKMCYMAAARALSIAWGDTVPYWTWTTDPDSRFPEIAVLRYVCTLEIRGVINTLTLSPKTHYAAYLVYKMMAFGFRSPVELSVNMFGGHGSTKNVCLDPNSEGNRFVGLQRPNVRSDGWLEIEMGEFFNAGLEDEVHMSVMEIKGGNLKCGHVVEGIEVRPKSEN